MIRIVAVLAYLALESAVKLGVDLIVFGIRNLAGVIRRRRARKAMESWHEEHGGPPDEILEDFNSQPDEVSMDALKGAAKSKLMWLGLAQIIYGLVQLWATGMLTIESAGPVVSGAVTMWLRAITTQSLADKAK